MAYYPKQNEAGFQKTVIEYAQLRGWKVLEIRKGMKKNGEYRTPFGANGNGWNDLFMVRGKRIVYVELKVGRNVMTPEQIDWQTVMGATGKVEVFNWYPEDWPEIENVLG